MRSVKKVKKIDVHSHIHIGEQIKKITTERDALLARYERIITAATAMNDGEKHELRVWEQANVSDDGCCATSDWPGWDAVINRISH